MKINIQVSFSFSLQIREAAIKYNTVYKGNHTTTNLNVIIPKSLQPVAEFKEFERRFKFKPRFKYGSLHLKLCQMFQDSSRR